MTIIQDEGTWHLESHLVIFASPLAAGDQEILDVTLDRPGSYLGQAATGRTSDDAFDLQVVPDVRHRDNSALVVGDRVDNSATDGIEIRVSNPGASNASNPVVTLMIWIRD